MAAAPCKECGRRPKVTGRHRCLTCALRFEPADVQAEAAARRLAMVPPELRVKRSKKILALAPAGTSWCAGCQSFRDLIDFGKGATTCSACTSAKAHAYRVEKTYDLSPAAYKALLKLQDGKCAICRNRPRSKRLAVDHDHKTGAVLGLLCSRCNHELKGGAWDSLAMATALWHYMNTPPTSGYWAPPEHAPRLAPVEDAGKALANATEDPAPFVHTHSGRSGGSTPTPAAPVGECGRPHAIPVGAVSVPGKRGVWRVWVEPDGDAPF